MPSNFTLRRIFAASFSGLRKFLYKLLKMHVCSSKYQLMVFSSFFQATRVRFVFGNDALVCPLNFAKYFFIVVSTMGSGNIFLPFAFGHGF